MSVVAAATRPSAPAKPNPLEYISASRLQTFHHCRLKFYFRYVLRLQKPKSAALHVGSVVHEVLQAWNRARWKRQRPDLDTLREHFAQHWIEQQALAPVTWSEEDPESKEMEAAWNLVRMYLQHTPIPLDERLEAVEVRVEADLEKHGLPKLVGILDLVRSGGRIVDYKTAGQTPNTERSIHLHELQLSCYALLYRDATGSKESGFELHHLVKLKTPKLVVTTAGPMTEAQRSRLFRSIDSFVTGVERHDWVPSPSPMACACCEYFNECRNWTGKDRYGPAL
jgi:CRISPR/Cas system-associated exonuclease Cas4 (RecB family)